MDGPLKIFMETYGCAFNMADSENMAGLLVEAGHTIVKTQEEADVIIQNTCTVKGPTESKFYTKLEKLKALGKHLVISGCIAQTDPKALKPFSTIGTDCVADIVECVEETAKGHIVRMIKRSKHERNNLPRVRANPLVEIIPINKGCLGSCTYCKTVHARGRLFSFSEEAILDRIKMAVEDDAKEIWLTSQDCGAYGKDVDTNLVQLLKKAVEIEGDFMIRVGMANPDHIIGMVDELVEVFKHKKIFKFLHCPVQSGSNRVLRDMKREYTVEEYRTIVETFRKEIPDITIANDIIVAFPGETDEEFEQTIALLKEVPNNVYNLSRFWPRPGTLAASMKPVNGSVSKARAKKAMEVLQEEAQKENAKWKTWSGVATVTEKSKKGSFVGRNHAYKPIIINHEGTRDLLGKTLSVEITETTPIDFRAILA